MSLKSAEFFKKLTTQIDKVGAELAPKIQAVFTFEIRESKGSTPSVFTVDLKNGNGHVQEGKVKRPDATFVVLDQDFVDLNEGKLKFEDAFMKKKL